MEGRGRPPSRGAFGLRRRVVRQRRPMTERLPPTWVPPVARRQSGLFTAAQARAAGATEDQVRRRRGTGRWPLVAGDALHLAREPVDGWLRAQAAGLTWPDAVVCLASAAVVHRLPVHEDGAVHVVVPNRRASRRLLLTHRLRLEEGEVLRIGLARVTSLRRTLFDCIGRLPAGESERLVAWAVTRELLTEVELGHAVADRPRWWGNTQRRRAVDDMVRGTLSMAERRLHDLLTASGLTGWAFDQRVHDAVGLIGRVDALFAVARVVIEVDGLAFHGPERFQTDRTRQNRLVAAGYTVLRFTWADLVDRPGPVLAQIRTVVDARTHRA